MKMVKLILVQRNARTSLADVASATRTDLGLHGLEETPVVGDHIVTPLATYVVLKRSLASGGGATVLEVGPERTGPGWG